MREINEKEKFSFVKQTKEFIYNLSYSNYSIFLFIMGVEKIIIGVFF